MRRNIIRGFSLIELMITVAIIGILASIALPSYQIYVKRAFSSKLISAAASTKPFVIQTIQGGNPTCSGRGGYHDNGPGNIGTSWFSSGTQCVAVGTYNALDGHFFMLGYATTINPDNTIAWNCLYWYSDPSAANKFDIPVGCTFWTY